ncbi:hypothetical protein L2E82_18308 [Cichorium intybus]|uniref:Uncharacterized protein n=1 Tax=Cichorium intybus TaxID=13427 RepID=A0ACB9F9C6_CICIN|nr:hypothetical protein L2E82_18308 [Cichorium intybus]
MQALNLIEGGEAHLAQAEGDVDAEAAEEEMMNLQFAFVVSTTPATTSAKSEVSEVSCSSQSCIDIIAKYREHNDRLVKEVFNLTNNVYDRKKKLKPLQEKLDAKISDFKKVQEEWSTVSTRYHCAKETIAKLTAELDALKAKFNDAEFNFKKFDVSVPPPYNHNYVSSVETEESEECYHSNFIKKDQSGTAECNKLNSTDASTSCVDNLKEKDEKKEDKSTFDFVKTFSKTNDSDSSVLNLSVKTAKIVRPFKNRDDVNFQTSSFKNSDKCSVACFCNVPRGRSYKRKPLRSRSRNKNWNDVKAKNQTAQNKKNVSRNDSALPNIVRSKSSQESTSNSSSDSKSDDKVPIWSKDKRFKSNYRWIPKGSIPTSTVNSPLFDNRDMSLESIKCIDSLGQPSFLMDWVLNLIDPATCAGTTVEEY